MGGIFIYFVSIFDKTTLKGKHSHRGLHSLVVKSAGSLTLDLSLPWIKPRSGHLCNAKFCIGRSDDFSPGTPVFAHL